MALLNKCFLRTPQSKKAKRKNSSIYSIIIYVKLSIQKQEAKNRTDLLIEDSRQVGNSAIAEECGR